MDLFFYQREYRKHVPVTVAKAPIDNLQLALDGGAEVNGIVTLRDEGETLTRGRIAFDDGVGDPVYAPVNEKGQFSVSLSPGHYNVDGRIVPGFYLIGLKAGQRDILREGLTVAGPGRIELRALLAKARAKIEGTVADEQGKPVAGIAVTLIPDGQLGSQLDLCREAQTDQAGNFTLDMAGEGRYRLFAWEDVDAGAWWDPDFMIQYEAKGTPITIDPDTRQQRIALTLLPNSRR
jgi:hypothetical protein